MQFLLRRLRFLSCGLLFAYLAVIGYRITRKQVPWTQILLPALVSVELMRLQLHRQSSMLTIAILAFAEITIFAAASILMLRSPSGTATPLEQRLANTIVLFMPPGVSRFAAAELTTLWMGLLWFTPAPKLKPDEFSYTAKTAIPYLPYIVLLGSVPETALLELFLAGRPFWMHAALLGLTIWSFLFVCGLSSSMKRRPHRIEHSFVTLHKGLASCTFHVAQIQCIEPATGIAIRRSRKQGNFSAGGAEAIDISLTRPVSMRTAFGNIRSVDTVRVSADELAIFQKAITRDATNVVLPSAVADGK